MAANTTKGEILKANVRNSFKKNTGLTDPNKIEEAKEEYDLVLGLWFVVCGLWIEDWGLGIGIEIENHGSLDRARRSLTNYLTLYSLRLALIALFWFFD